MEQVQQNGTNLNRLERNTVLTSNLFWLAIYHSAFDVWRPIAVQKMEELHEQQFKF